MAESPHAVGHPNMYFVLGDSPTIIADMPPENFINEFPDNSVVAFVHKVGKDAKSRVELVDYLTKHDVVPVFVRNLEPYAATALIQRNDILSDPRKNEVTATYLIKENRKFSIIR